MKTGLVFAGGGSKGAYEIGVWQALRELDIQIDFVCGTSIGGLNGALVCQDDLNHAIALWNRIHVDNVFVGGVNLSYDIDLLMSQRGKMLQLFKQSIQNKGASNENLHRFIRSNIDVKKIYHSPITLGLVVYNVDKRRGEEWIIDDIPPRQLVDYLVATASCFPALQMKEINGTHYIDGGYYDNFPIAFARRQGCTNIIAVKLKPDDSKIPDDVHAIVPKWYLGTFLYFEPKQAKRNLTLGYLDTMKSFDQLLGGSYTFSLACDPKIKLFEQLVKRALADFKAQRNKYLTTVLDEVLKRRLLKANDPLFGFHALEDCARLYRLDPCKIYDFDTFIIALLAAFNATHRLEDVGADVGDNLKRMDRRKIVKFLYEDYHSHQHLVYGTYILSLGLMDDSIHAVMIHIAKQYVTLTRHNEQKELA
ncbi:MAG: patatin-like phospholipase family protein [Erysipelotrichaceae bacterium]